MDLYPAEQILQEFIINNIRSLNGQLLQNLCKKAVNAEVIDSLLPKLKASITKTDNQDTALLSLLNNKYLTPNHLAFISEMNISSNVIDSILNNPSLIDDKVFNHLSGKKDIDVKLMNTISNPKKPSKVSWSIIINQPKMETYFSQKDIQNYLDTLSTIIKLMPNQKITSSIPLLVKTISRERKEQNIKSGIYKLNLSIAKNNIEEIKQQFKTLCQTACEKRNALSVFVSGKYSTNTTSAQFLITEMIKNPEILKALNIKADKVKLEKAMLLACQETTLPSPKKTIKKDC